MIAMNLFKALELKIRTRYFFGQLILPLFGFSLIYKEMKQRLESFISYNTGSGKVGVKVPDILHIFIVLNFHFVHNDHID